MKTSFINNILNSQPILIKIALKLFVCKCLSFSDTFTSWLAFPFKHTSVSSIKHTATITIKLNEYTTK